MNVGFFRYEGRGIRLGDQPPRYERIDWDVYNTSTLGNKVRDALTALAVARRQAGVDSTRILLMGTSEGTLLAAEAASRAPGQIAGLVLYAVMADNMRDVFRFIITEGAFLPTSRMRTTRSTSACTSCGASSRRAIRRSSLFSRSRWASGGSRGRCEPLRHRPPIAILAAQFKGVAGLCRLQGASGTVGPPFVRPRTPYALSWDLPRPPIPHCIRLSHHGRRPMTTAGWIMMIISLAFVWSLVIWCYKKVLSSAQKEEVPPGFGP
jgi:pimeloyl-ACP methyl ester carboxylesterase